MLQPRRGGTYVCWNCLARGVRPRTATSVPDLQRPRVASRLSASPRVRIGIQTFTTIKRQRPSLARPPKGSSLAAAGTAEPKQPSIREQLAQWDKEHGQTKVTDKDNIVFKLPWAAHNNSTRSQTSHGAVDLDEDPGGSLDEQVDFDLEQDLQPLSSGIQVGDLVEFLSNAQRARQMAVCIARIDGIDHFYADNGSWIFTRAASTMFIVPGFASEADIAPVRDALPPTGTSEAALLELREKHQGPTRALAEGLLRKMTKFTAKANAAMQAYSARLEGAHEAVLQSGPSFITAEEAAEMVLPHHARDPDTLEIPVEAVYAVHRAMLKHEEGFCPFFRAAFGLRGCLFEVLPAEDVDAVRSVKNIVRAYYLDQTWQSPDGTPEKRRPKNRLERFVDRARRQIDRSRRLRDHSAGMGILGPCPPVSEAEAEAKAVAGADDAPLQATGWLDEEDDAEIMRFMYLWAASRKFSSDSDINVYGSTILKALGRYSHIERLDVSVGWMFLQEVGWILPWDFAARHTLPPPGLQVSRTGGILDRPEPIAPEALQRDVYPGKRRDWGDTKIYCIDSASTTDVDDGLSIERTDTPGQYWIHVHVADPTSAIVSGDPAAKYAETITQTIYLPGHYEPMFPGDTVKDHFSLAPGSRCLTFSAKLDESGAVLDLDITPGTLHNVVYMTVDELATLCPFPPGPKSPQDSIRVGPELPPEELPSAQTKPLSRISDLSPEAVEDLKLLSRLTDARRAVLEANGGMPASAFRPRSVARLSFEHTRVVDAPDGSFRALGDPSIEVSYPDNGGHTLVSTSMLLAGEVAGRWCAARGIPMPFRTMPQAELNRAVLMPWARDVFYPKVLSDRPLDTTDENSFAALAGQHQLSATPGPYFLLGLDVYVKVTSPLRRYADLLAHWQIHAALAEEARQRDAGAAPASLVSLASLATATADAAQLAAAAASASPQSSLPFPQARLEREVLPMLRLREFAAARLSREHSHYSLQALARAWRFGQAPLPDTFVFRVSRPRVRRPIQGRLSSFFDVRCFLVPADAAAADGCPEEQPVDLSSLKTDDLVEVRLKSVDPSTPMVLVEAVRKLDGSAATTDGQT
ncbi:hypothetical protein RB595_009282 [Gaeumannomyces hyphopodioides]